MNCDYCNKIALYNIMGDFYHGDTVVGHVCRDHVDEALEKREDIHHFEMRSKDELTADWNALRPTRAA